MLNIFSKIFGTRNYKILKKYLKKVKLVNALESTYEQMDDEQLKQVFQDLKQQVQNNEKTVEEV